MGIDSKTETDAATARETEANTTAETKLDSLSAQVLKQERTDREALAFLVAKYSEVQNKLLVQPTNMGSVKSYIGSVTLEWLANHVCFASQLPMFKDKVELQSGNLVRDNETIEHMLQRPLNWARQSVLTTYLTSQKSHKFPPVLTVLSPRWVSSPYAVQWNNAERRCTVDSADFDPLDKNGTVGLLDVGEDVSIFALDGQHRLMGIQGLMELLKTGMLCKYDRNKKAKKTYPLTTEDLEKNSGIDLGYLQGLAKEKIGIEFIPAVAAGETIEEASRRVRSIFTHVNITGVKLTKGQLAALNEDNGFAIIARNIAVTHPLLKDRVEFDNSTIRTKSQALTTLHTLQSMCEAYLAPTHPFSTWQSKSSESSDGIPVRPRKTDINKGIQEFTKLWHHLAKLPSYKRLKDDVETTQLRNLSHDKPEGEGNMLFRPTGQLALASAIGELRSKHKIDLNTIFDQLHQYDLNGGFSAITLPSSLWYGILYDPNRKKIVASGRDLATQLIIYMMTGVTDDRQRSKLRQKLADARTFENKAMNFDGKFTEIDDIPLPKMLWTPSPEKEDAAAA